MAGVSALPLQAMPETEKEIDKTAATNVLAIFRLRGFWYEVKA
jgi:hypothetical protein